MHLSDLAIKRPVFMSMILLAFVLFGFIAFRTLGVDLYPKVDFPVVTIVSTLPSADPHTMEATVTEPTEEAVSTLDSIENLRSISAEGVSQVIIEFNLKKNIDIAFQEVQAKLASIRSNLPHDLFGPIIDKYNIDAVPILSLIASSDLPVDELTHLIETEVKEPLKRIPHIGQIKLVGERKHKIWLRVDPKQMEGYGLTIQDVEQGIKTHHIDLPAGRMTKNSAEFLVKTKGELFSVESFNDVIIAQRNGVPIPFRAIGKAEAGMEEERSSATFNGTSAIALMIGKQSGANTVEVAKQLKKIIKQLQQDLKSKKIRLEITQDNSVFIEKSVEEVRFHLLFGGGLAILIVLLFLRNLRSTFVCALALPTAVIGTFAFMSYFDFTQNVMTLLALSLAIGLLIDDAIVVQENIIRHLEKGYSPLEASSVATRQIALAVLATTLSVVAVFIPVAFMKGIVGRFFYQFGVTVSIAVLISMLVSFTLNPLFSSRLLTPSKRGALYQFLERLFQTIERGYASLLKVSLKYKKSVLSLALLSFLFSIYLFGHLRFEFAPVVDQSEFSVSLKTPLESSLTQTKGVVKDVEGRIRNYPWVDYLFSTIGADRLGSVNKASIYVKMLPKEKRKTSQREAMARIRNDLSSFSLVHCTVSTAERGAGGGQGKATDLQFEICGPSIEQLSLISERVMKKMKEAKGYVDIEISLEAEKPQINVMINRAAAADAGISPFLIASTLKTAIGGSDITSLKKDGVRDDVTLRFSQEFRNDPSHIAEILLKNPAGKLIPLQDLVTLCEEKGPTQINRSNKMRQVTVSANLIHSQKVLGEALKEITSFFAQEKLPDGYRFKFSGAAIMFQDSFNNLFFALGLAVILVYMVLAAQFESLIHPFIIMLTLPLSIVGAIGSLVIFHMTMSIFTMIGIIMLMGLVTKNGILLVDFINTLYHKEKKERDEAIIQAGKFRLRPILMTTLAVVCGMLPIALGKGAGSESRSPMAVAVIGGLITSTLLTLVVIPVVYALVEDLRKKKFFMTFFFKKIRESVVFLKKENA